MADATLLSVMSKQIEDNKQATEDLRSQVADLAKSLSLMDAKLSMLVSPSSSQSSRASGLNASPSGCLTNSKMTPLLPEPPDPPDFNQFGQRLSKLEFPVFDGTLLDCWIAKVDRIFELEQYGNEEKLDFISLSLEGAALKWFRRHRREFTDWTYIKRKLMARFGLVKGCSPPEVLPEEKLITKVDQDTDFGSEKESSNSVEITSVKGHEVKGTTVSHSATYCAKQIHQNEEFPHLHVTDSTSKLSRNLSLIMHQVDNSVLENQKKLARKAEIPVFENLHEPSRLFDEESQGILRDHTLVPMKPYQSYSQSWYELDTIQSDINFKVWVAHECDMVGVVVIYEVATTFEKLAKTWKFKFKSNPERSKLLDDMFPFMEKSSEKYVMVRESHHRLLESQQGNGLSLLNCLIAHDVLRLSSSEYTKHTLILVYHLCSLSSSRLFVKIYAGCIVALLMVYDAERLIQSNAPPIFSDLLCVKNRIRVRLKMVLLLEILWLILFSSKMFKSSNVHQNKNQTDQKLSSYWKLLLRLLHPLHINKWRSFYLLVIKPLFKGKKESVSFNVAVTSCSSYVKVLELIKDRDSRKRKLCKNWWFKYKLYTWLSEALHLWRKRKSEKLQILGRATHGLLLKQNFSQVLLHIQNRDYSFFGYMLVATSLVETENIYSFSVKGTHMEGEIMGFKLLLTSGFNWKTFIEWVKIYFSEKQHQENTRLMRSATTKLIRSDFCHLFVRKIHVIWALHNFEKTVAATKVNQNSETSQDCYLLLFLERVKASFEIKFTMEQSEKPLITILSYEWFHSPRPPELACCKEDEESTAKFSYLRTSMFSSREYCDRVYLNHTTLTHFYL